MCAAQLTGGICYRASGSGAGEKREDVATDADKVFQAPITGAGIGETMINKCFLYIDGYPRNASDVPFDIAIDWGDGSPLEQYFRLRVDKVPQFYHIYNDMEPKEILVTITNSCGTATRTVLYVPFVPPECECQNFYNLDINNVLVSFSGVDWDLEISGCFIEVEADADYVTARMVTDVSTNLPLVAFPVICIEIPEGTFDLVTSGIPTEEAVLNVYTHLGPGYPVTPYSGFAVPLVQSMGQSVEQTASNVKIEPDSLVLALTQPRTNNEGDGYV